MWASTRLESRGLGRDEWTFGNPWPWRYPWTLQVGAGGIRRRDDDPDPSPTINPKRAGRPIAESRAAPRWSCGLRTWGADPAIRDQRPAIEL